tara:strand:- start:1217 stop:1546 length:330 start_codon:yes stop_codon:yes gene_type:complete
MTDEIEDRITAWHLECDEADEDIQATIMPHINSIMALLDHGDGTEEQAVDVIKAVTSRALALTQAVHGQYAKLLGLCLLVKAFKVKDLDDVLVMLRAEVMESIDKEGIP